MIVKDVHVHLQNVIKNVQDHLEDRVHALQAGDIREIGKDLRNHIVEDGLNLNQRSLMKMSYPVKREESLKIRKLLMRKS